MSDSKELIAELRNPEEAHPGNFDTPERANALLACLCQKAADALERMEAERDELLAALELMKRDKWHWEEIRDAAIARVKGK